MLSRQGLHTRRSPCGVFLFLCSSECLAGRVKFAHISFFSEESIRGFSSFEIRYTNSLSCSSGKVGKKGKFMRSETGSNETFASGKSTFPNLFEVETSILPDPSSWFHFSPRLNSLHPAKDVLASLHWHTMKIKWIRKTVNGKVSDHSKAS